MKRVYLPNLLNKIPTELLKNSLFIIKFLEENYNAHCFIVGGAVRDLLLKRDVFDIDIECFNISQNDFEEAMGELGALGVGKSFFVYKYKSIDISLPRIESKIGFGHRGFEVKLAKNPKEASKRRDFTINALMFDTKSKEVIDFWGGLEDLEAKLLRATNQESFIEDSLRVLRAVQFGARFGFRLEKKTCLLCQNIDLNDLPKERIFGELKKLFLGKYLHYGLFALTQTDTDKKIFGFKISKEEFFKISKALLKYQKNFKNFLPNLREFYFLAILRRFIEFDMEKFLRGVGASNLYLKKLVVEYPKRVDLEFVANLAKKEPVKNSVFSYDDEVIAIAKKIDVWERAFDTGVTPKELMEKGFRGKALGEELERVRREKIEQLKSIYS